MQPLQHTVPATGPPVVVRARLDPPLSRWLWLVKWLLLVPHYLVLMLLWVAFVVVAAVALVAVLVTGRYPRELFAFNLGVLRWSWRVAWYGYSGLGTDRYPPFTLDEVPGYPATLDIAYPESSPRGLSLLQPWLLAAPHLLVLAVLTSGASWVLASDRLDQPGLSVGTGGLVGLLAVFAGVVLLVGRPYPAGLFGLLTGLDRYVLRVVAYASLMTTAYPPFRLDQGGDEPGAPGPGGPAPSASDVDLREPRVQGPVVREPAADTPAPRTGAVVALAVGVVLLLPGLALTGLGAAGMRASDDAAGDGFVSSADRTLETDTAAVTAGPVELELELDEEVAPWLPQGWGQVRLQVSSANDSPVFVGIAPREDVEAWLAGVAHEEVRSTGLDGSVRYDRVDGGREAGTPAGQTFWAASAAGTGVQEVMWPTEPGQWVAVVAGTDGAPGVAADVSVAARAPVVAWGSVAALAVGVPLVLVGLLLVVLGAILGRGRRTSPDGGPPPQPGPPATREPAPVAAGTAAG